MSSILKLWAPVLAFFVSCDLLAQLSPADNQFPRIGGALVRDIPGPPEARTLGHALISFDTNADGFDELIIGVPEDTWGSAEFTGALFQVSGTEQGLDVADGAAQYIAQANLGE